MRGARPAYNVPHFKKNFIKCETPELISYQVKRRKMISIIRIRTYLPSAAHFIIEVPVRTVNRVQGIADVIAATS
jgi:hypothetical protein